MLDYVCLHNRLPEGVCEESLGRLHDRIFGRADMGERMAELVTKPTYVIFLAMADGEVAGYKIGYEERANRFYSWLGGVNPEFRKQGIASELMRRQHEWCREHGYTSIRTHTMNRWKEMLILNLRHDFDVIGTFADRHGDSKIILEKSLV